MALLREPGVPGIRKASFGRSKDGQDVDLFRLTNGNGLEMDITTYGGIVTALRVPDARGQVDDIVLGFDTLEGYLGGHPYFGGIIGRFGNRIARGRFHLDGREHVLACNNGPNHLHGGVRGFDRVVWKAEARLAAGTTSLFLRYTSPDGDQGYPGELDCEVVYTLTNDHAVRIDYVARTDRPTIVNLTHHSYFNLAGPLGGDILGHHLFVDADTFTPVDESLIPSGELRPVAGTAFDFRASARIGAKMNEGDPQLDIGHGYDHNFVLNHGRRSDVPRFVARVLEPRFGRAMDVLTTEPGLQVYAGGGLDGSITGKGGRVYQRHGGLCLETQAFPDSPNQPTFPSVRLDPGQTYRSVTIYRFSSAPAGHAIG